MNPILHAVVIAANTIQALGSTPPAPRAIGSIERVSTDTLRSIWTAVEVSGRRVFVQDAVQRRLLLFDSTLARSTVVLDSSGSAANAYGQLMGTLAAYHGDSVVFLAPDTRTILVITASGAIARTMAMPSAFRAMGGSTIANLVGPPGFDSAGRLIFLQDVITPRARPTPGTPSTFQTPDSALIVRADLGTRTLDTIASVRTPRIRNVVTYNDLMQMTSSASAVFPMAIVDDWAVLPDGTLAVLRGQDYHIDWFATNGKVQAGSRMAFSWERMSDDRKQHLMDSTVAARQAAWDSALAKVSGSGPPRPGGPPRIVRTFVAAPLSDMPDYQPPFAQASVRADGSGNVWIHSTAKATGEAVYDVASRKGEITDRIVLPRFRRLAGFGAGVVYLSVLDSAGIVHLERARLK